MRQESAMKSHLETLFPTGRDSATFRDKGSLGQAKNLAKGRDGLRQPKSRMGRAGTAKIPDGTRDKTRQSRKVCSETGKGCSKTEKDVLKHERIF